MKSLASILRLFLWRIVLLAGLSLLTAYFIYRIVFINFSPILVVFSLILFVAELHTIFLFYGLFYALWPRNYSQYLKSYKNRNLRFNIFVCVCGEPVEIVRETVLAAKKTAVHYDEVVRPYRSTQVVVLNDGKVAKKDNWEQIADLAVELNVGHIARSVPGGFKAGNINNGLKLTPTSDSFNTLDVVFDADFAAKENFLLEMVKPFEDRSVDFVQSPQRYKNDTTWVAQASAAQQIFFFDYLCSVKGHDNALFLCGTNFAIRRSALDAVGGMNTDYITEDYATSLDLHLSGHKGVFMPRVLAEGIAPSSLKAFFSQQQRWSKGNFDVTRAYLKRIVFGPLTIKQKFHYLLSATFYLIGLRDLILMLATLPYLFFGIALIKANTWGYLAFIYCPLLALNITLFFALFRHPVKSLVLGLASFPVFVSSFLSSALKKDLSFIVTIKKYEKENPLVVYKFQILVAAVLLFGLFAGLRHSVGNGGAVLNYFWAGFDATSLLFGFYLVVRENVSITFSETLFNLRKLSRSLFRIPVPSLSRVSYSLGVAGMVIYLAFLPSYTQNFAAVEGSKPKVTQELLVPQNGIYFGYYLPTLNSHPTGAIQQAIGGEKTSLSMFYQDWSNENLFDSDFVSRLASSGRIPVITWEPWDANQIDKKIFTPEEIISGKYDSFIHSWSKLAASWGKPFFLRFAHEMNGNWYPWGNMNSPQTYVTMWQHVHDIFVQEGATNALWVWSPNNTDERGSSENLLSYYPGDNYVDWTAFSGFNWGTSSRVSRWISFKQIASSVYEKLSTVNKPIMVAETSSASAGGNKENWFDQTLMRDLPQLPRIKAVVLFDQDFNKSDFSLTSGQDFNSVLQNDVVNNSYYLKDPVYKVKYLP